MNTKFTNFVRRKAVDATETEMPERRVTTIPAQDWEKFEAWAQRPAQEIAALKELASTSPTWQH